jgi:hypothetical protein
VAGTVKAIAGPAFLAAAVANIFTPLASGFYTDIMHIHLFNVTAVAVTFTLYIGATGGSASGTELFKQMSLAANTPYDYYCVRRMVSTDFLTGLASAGSSITITVEGEQGVL